MATQNASNQKFTNQADGFVLGGGTTQRNLTVTGANVTLTGSGSNTHTFPASSQTLVGRSSTDTLTNKTIDANGTGNSITNLEVADFASGVIDTDLSSVSGSDDTLPSAKATKAALDGKRAAFMTGTIATAVGTAAKTVTLNSPWASHTPAAGDMYLFTYTNGTTAASATIAINGGSALAVRIANAAATAVPHTTAAGGVMLYYFDGTNLHLIGSQRNSDTDTNTTYVSTPTTFTTVTGTTQAAAVNNAYQANNAAQVVFTLPGTAAVGNVVVVSGLGAGGWRINAPAGDTIRVGATVSASGGYIASNNQYDSVTLMCIVANADWVAVGYTGLVSVDGTIALDSTLIDEDSFATDTDRRAPTQQSTKAYITSQINAIPAATMTLTNKTISGSSNTLSNIALTSILPSTSTAVGVGSVELGHATDTTLARGAAGRLTVEGINVPTVSSTDTLTNKTLSAPRVDIIDDINGMAILGLYETASAVNYLGIHNRTTTNEPYISANGTDADINIGLVPKGDGDVRIYKSTGEVRIYANGGDANVDLNLQTKGSGVVKAKGIELATISSSQTLTNKTLTNPRINSIFDTNSNSILGLYGISSAVNQYYVTNQSAGNYPTIGVEGSDTNIGIVFAPKGAGPVRIYSPSGQTATIDVAGPDTNIDIDLKPKGAGVVKISGTPLLSAAGAATLTNKTISGANNTLTALPYDLTAVAFGYVSPRAVGVGDFPFGIKLQRACTLTSVTYRCNTADASGNLVVELRKNGVAVSGSSATIAAANQITGGTSTGTWSFAAGDILTVYVTAVGTTPGNGLIADITGVTA
jgi:hypothetical protein